MAYRKFPPRGYKQQEFPLPHNFAYGCSFTMEDETKNSTILTLLRTSELAIGADAIEVNPSNAAFGEDPGSMIHPGSIVPKINFSMHMKMSKLAIETDKIRTIKMDWWPIYFSFLSSLEAEDARTAVQIEDIFEMQHETTNKSAFPLFSTVSMLNSATTGIGSQPLSTKPFTETITHIGLDTDAALESVAFDKEQLYDALQFFGNGGMLRKVLGRHHSVILERDRPYIYHSNNFTNPIVKRGNNYTYCGVLIHCPQANAADQFNFATEVTAIAHVDMKAFVRYDEWNPNFDQQAY